MKPNELLDEKMQKVGYYTPATIADRLGLARTSIYGKINAGELEPYKFGARIYVHLDSLIEHLGPVASEFFPEAKGRMSIIRRPKKETP